MLNFIENEWKMGGDLPEPVSNSAAVSSRSSEFVGYLAGGHATWRVTSKIWGLRRFDLVWIEMSKRLQAPRTFHTLVNVHLDEIPGC